jgi:hypothetical protein
MKKFMVVAVLASFASLAQARADGFSCQTSEGDLNVRMFNHTQAVEGTRNAAVMVLSDTGVQAGRKTIARFTDVNQTLTNHGATYVARVDLRYNDSGRKGELVSGTKLGELKTIHVDVAFSYARPLRAGQVVYGSMQLVKRNGQKIIRDLSCERYLKQQ